MDSIQPILWLLATLAVVLIILLIAKQLVYRHRREQVRTAIDQAQSLAAKMKPGQTIVKSLPTPTDEQLSAFLAPFNAERFKVHISNERVGNVQSNHLVTVVTITKHAK